MIQVNIQNKKYQLDEKNKLGTGTEGTVYSLNHSECFKHFPDEYLRKNRKLDKLIALLGRYNEISNLNFFEHITFPMNLGYLSSSHDHVLGFSMKKVTSAKSISLFRYQILKGAYGIENLTDKHCIQLVRLLFDLLQGMHSQNIILGDVNPENILLDESFKPFFIDFDSIKFGDYECSTNGFPDYICQSILDLGQNQNKRYTFSKGSDIYALASICFELLIGVLPNDVPVSPITDINKLKKLNIGFLSFVDENQNIQDYSIGDLNFFKFVKKRIQEIRSLDRPLMEFFEKILHSDERFFPSKLETKKSIKIVREKEITVRPVRGYTPAFKRKDPEALLPFLERFNLNLPL